MIRFILERKQEYRGSCKRVTIETYDLSEEVGSIIELEDLLLRGGFNEAGYDHTHLINIEVRRDKSPFKR